MLVVMFVMLLGACAPAPAPTAEPVVEEPDFREVFAEGIANNGKDAGYGIVALEALNHSQLTLK